MKMIYNNKSIEIKNCVTFSDRLIGFMFKSNFNYGMLFPNCNSIHTFFMKEAIDVIMLDENNKILYFYPSLKKNKIIWPKKNVKKVIELPTNKFNLKVGAKIKINNS